MRLQSAVFTDLASIVTDLQTVQHEAAISQLAFRRALDTDSATVLERDVLNRLSAVRDMVNRTRGRELTKLRSTAASTAMRDDFLALEQKLAFYAGLLNSAWINRYVADPIGNPRQSIDAALQDILILSMLLTEQVEGEIITAEIRIAKLNLWALLLLSTLVAISLIVWFRNGIALRRPPDYHDRSPGSRVGSFDG